ncbi:hypothetical protein SDRG_05101 [Saprolegnia diclina VS20]|uniref:Uncharacterized protein n=1 Tax=Saprolegnia diclina (strain VS20) TaxID=1156394 RepID=T0RY89_SAPDV|nr:hypothetical protein SDRG_05101 [Saprolegnia diclina VS20]EQC37498.1 hypothetical protein SDRG_05101 [Saprolegnia diclina VS20]|eukprot:XP_008609018.1 hypothetical protein SDRG_05101 [Saprolegnia diclina VS20]
MWSSQSDEDHDMLDDAASQAPAQEDPGQQVGGDGENLDEEMAAMKHVFQRMSEKKARQKTQGMADCVQVYTDAFQKDLDQLFALAKKKRIAEAQGVNSTIQTTMKQIEEHKRDLMTVHETYEANFTASIERVEQELERLKELRKTVVGAYDTGKQQVEASFKDAFANVDAMIVRLQADSSAVLVDTSYLDAFQAEAARFVIE